MDLTQIGEIKELSSESTKYDNVVKKVNQYLDEGWKLLNIYTTCYDPEVFPKHQSVHYILGLPIAKKLLRDYTTTESSPDAQE